MNKDISLILKEATKDMLSEDTLKQIQEAFDVAVTDKSKILVDKALEDQDTDYSSKLERLIEAIDKDHVVKLNRVVDAIDKNHTAKLSTIVEHYEARLNTDASAFKGYLVSKLSRYLDVYLNKAVPTKTIKEAAQNRRAEMLVADLRKTLAVDYAIANESIRDAIIDGKRTIDNLKKKVAELETSKESLTESVDDTKAQLLIEQKVSTLPADKQKYMRRVMADKSPTYITENFEYVLNLIDEKEQSTIEALTEEAIEQTNSVDAKSAPITESVEGKEKTSDDPMFNTYMTELKKY